MLIILGVLGVLGGLGVGIWKWRAPSTLPKIAEVLVPTIVNGELVIPKGGDLGLQVTPGLEQAKKEMTGPQLYVVSANLVGVFGQDPNSTDSAAQKLTGVRALGEIKNGGDARVKGFLPIVKFFDSKGKVLTQKVGRNNANYDFFGLDPQDVTVYDVMVDDPPSNSERVEVVFKPQETGGIDKVALKVANREIASQEVQTQSGQKATVYTVSGKLVNSTDSSMADLTVMAYVKDTEGKVVGLGRQDFRSDLIGPGEQVPFKIMVLPVKADATSDSYEVRVWGKEYKL